MNTLPPISPETLAAAERFRAPLEAYGRACGAARRAMNAFCQNPTPETWHAVTLAMVDVRDTRAALDDAMKVTR